MIATGLLSIVVTVLRRPLAALCFTNWTNNIEM